MLPLKFPRFWMGLGWALVALVVIGSLIPWGVVELPSNDKFLHFSAYFSLTVWFCGLYGKLRHYLLVAVTLITLGAALDMAQGMLPYRSFDIRDIFANGVGIAAGLALSALFLGGWCQALEKRLFAN